MLITAGSLPVCAQNDTILTNLAKHDAATQLVTSSWDVGTIGKIPTYFKAIAVTNKPDIFGEDRYIKKKEEGEKYAEFQAFDLRKSNRGEIASGLVTNTFDRVTRYEEKAGQNKKGDQKEYSGEPDKSTVSSINDESAKVSGLSAFRFRDKYFLIIGNNDYRYVDGKKLVGSQKVVDALMQGKPITEMTFFYELQEAGAIDKNMTASQFTRLSTSQKQELLNDNAVPISL